MRDVALGLDLATASARCVALDTGSGAVLASASASLAAPVRDGYGSSTQEATYAFVAADLLRRVSAELGPRARGVGAVSVTGTSGTVVACDASGMPVGVARLYDDLSGADLARQAEVSGGSMLARVAALAREIPGSTFYGSSADVVGSSLVGHRVPGDTSHWLKAGIDPLAATWPEADLQALGLETDELPGLVRPGTVIGEVADDIADRIGLARGVVVVAGMTDGCTAQIATGAVRPGDTVGVLGTTLVLKAVSDTEIRTSDGAVYSHLAPDGRWWAGGASNSGAGVLGAEFPDADLAGMDRSVSETLSSVVLYPLSVVGERFPISDQELTWISSGEPKDKQDAYRAVLEGVAFVERLGLERLASLGAAPRRHVLAGGASASTVWNRIRATVLAPLVPVEVTGRAGSAIGAAMLAAEAMDGSDGGFAIVVERLASRPVSVEPVVTQRDPLEDAYRRFLDLLSTATTQPYEDPDERNRR